MLVQSITRELVGVPMIWQVQVRIHLFLSGVRGSCTTLFSYPWARIPQSTSGEEWAGDSFHTAKSWGDSRSSSPTVRGEGIASSQLLLFISSHDDFLFINGEACYSHQRPGCEGRFLGRYSAEERFLGRLCGRHLGGRDPFEVILGSE